MNVRRYFISTVETRIISFFIIQVQFHLSSFTLLPDLFVGLDGGFSVMIGQIACQSNSLWRVCSLNSTTIKKCGVCNIFTILEKSHLFDQKYSKH